jgi:hypothetical protein
VAVLVPEKIGLADIKRQASYLDHAWMTSRFTVVARHLPKLMADAQAAVQANIGADHVHACRILVTSYRLASSMLLKLESHDVAWLVADRAMHTALSVDDTWSMARATRSVARAMTGIHEQPQAIAVLLAMADRMRDEVNADVGQLLALQGMRTSQPRSRRPDRRTPRSPGRCTKRRWPPHTGSSLITTTTARSSGSPTP